MECYASVVTYVKALSSVTTSGMGYDKFES